MIADGEYCVELLTAKTLKRIKALPIEGYLLICGIISKNYLIVAGKPTKLFCFNLNSYELMKTLDLPHNVYSMVLLEDSSKILFGEAGGDI
jgi:hypothetical protein